MTKRKLALTLGAAVLAIGVTGCVREPNNPIPSYINIGNPDIERSVQIIELSKYWDEDGLLVVELEFKNLTERTMALRVITEFLDETGSDVGDSTPASSVILRGYGSKKYTVKSIKPGSVDLKMTITST